uniref:Uncharacterized protein n=1 Tax=Arundo donax TaxID=35708 RepID=A0A0A9BBU2_ARUDO
MPLAVICLCLDDCIDTIFVVICVFVVVLLE